MKQKRKKKLSAPKKPSAKKLSTPKPSATKKPSAVNNLSKPMHSIEPSKVQKLDILIFYTIILFMLYLILFTLNPTFFKGGFYFTSIIISFVLLQYWKHKLAQ